MRSLDTNVDEVFDRPDLSLVPLAFLTEIKEDPIYATILHELEKKIALQSSERRSLSPHVFALCSDDVDHAPSAVNDQDAYDTDIEPGNDLQVSISFVLDGGSRH